MDRAVCDAGPLIHLAEIHKEDLLVQFSPLIIPEIVLAEAVSFRPPQDFPFELADPLEEDRAKIRRRIQCHLGAGEVDAIAVCLKTSPSLLLTDDRKARREAERLGLAVHGSIGIVVRAFRIGHLEMAQAEQAIYELGNSRTLFISKAIIETARQQLRTHVGR